MTLELLAASYLVSALIAIFAAYLFSVQEPPPAAILLAGVSLLYAITAAVLTTLAWRRRWPLARGTFVVCAIGYLGGWFVTSLDVGGLSALEIGGLLVVGAPLSLQYWAIARCMEQT